MKKITLAFAFFSSAACAQTIEPNAQSFSFYGQWHVDSINGYAEFSAGDDELKRLIGQQVTITKDNLKIGAETCNTFDLRATDRETTSLLLEQYKAGPDDAGVPARTLVLDAQPCGYVFRAGANIVFNQDGAFYRASRMDTDGK